MVDQILAWAVVILPTIFALGIEVVSKEIREHPYWRIGVIVFGIGLSSLTWFQMSQATKVANREQERAIERVSAKVSESVSKSVSESVSSSVKASSEALLKFATNPPKGVTREQMASIVNAYLRRTDPQAPIDLIAGMMERVTSSLRDLPGEWKAADKNEQLGLWEQQTHAPHTEAETQTEGDIKRKITEQNRQYKRQLIDVLGDAEHFRELLVAMLPRDKRTAEDETVKRLLSTLRSADIQEPYQCHDDETNTVADYLDTLVKRIPKS